jgi:hypothetical protein
MTVKKNDGTTDVIYASSVGAAGDNPAIWFAPALGATSSTRPELRVHSKPIPGFPNKRRLIGTFMYPYSVVNSTTGMTTVEKRVLFKLQTDTDYDIPSTSMYEAASQGLNLFAHALMKSMVKEGAAAT